MNDQILNGIDSHKEKNHLTHSDIKINGNSEIKHTMAIDTTEKQDSPKKILEENFGVEDGEDNCSLKLCLSDDDEDLEQETNSNNLAANDLTSKKNENISDIKDDKENNKSANNVSVKDILNDIDDYLNDADSDQKLSNSSDENKIQETDCTKSNSKNETEVACQNSDGEKCKASENDSNDKENETSTSQLLKDDSRTNDSAKTSNKLDENNENKKTVENVKESNDKSLPETDQTNTFNNLLVPRESSDPLDENLLTEQDDSPDSDLPDEESETVDDQEAVDETDCIEEDIEMTDNQDQTDNINETDLQFSNVISLQSDKEHTGESVDTNISDNSMGLEMSNITSGEDTINNEESMSNEKNDPEEEKQINETSNKTETNTTNTETDTNLKDNELMENEKQDDTAEKGNDKNELEQNNDIVESNSTEGVKRKKLDADEDDEKDNKEKEENSSKKLKISNEISVSIDKSGDNIEVKSEEKITNEIKIKSDGKINKKDLILKMLPLIFENESTISVNIEELILTKFVESVAHRTELAQYRQKLRTQEATIDKLRRKCSHLQKQVEDMCTVTNRLAVDLLQKDRPAIPVKVTRSVGLQVSIQPTGMTKRTGQNITNLNRKRSNTEISGANSSFQPIAPKVTQKVSNTNTSNTSVNKQPAQIQSLLNKALVKTPQKPVNQLPPDHATVNTRPVQSNNDKSNKPVIDLTDEDSTTDSKNKNSLVVSQTPPNLIPLGTSNLRMVTTLGGTNVTNTVQGQRVTYLMATPTNGTNKGQLLIATSAPSNTNRPGLVANVRPQSQTRYLLQNPNSPTLVQRPGIVLTNRQTPLRGVPVRIGRNGIAQNRNGSVQIAAHPAALPIVMSQPHLPGWREIPPRPSLKITRTRDGGIQLSWSMPDLDQKIHEDVASYQLYAYQEGNAPPSTDLWRKVGDVKALPLPMACTLTSFQTGNRYYFAVRAIDIHSRVSLFSYAQPVSHSN